MNTGAAIFAVLLAVAPVRAAAYEHPREHWRIDFPSGWRTSDESGLGTVARAPTGTARLRVEKFAVPPGVGNVDAWERSDAPRLAHRYGPAHVLIRETTSLRGIRGARVEFEYNDPRTGRAMRGWRMVLLQGGVVDTVTFEVAVGDYDAAQRAAENALKSFQPSFARTPSRFSAIWSALFGGNVASGSNP